MELSQEDRILLIQELRQKTHASIRQLSEVTGISRYNVRYWKNNTKGPSLWGNASK